MLVATQAIFAHQMEGVFLTRKRSQPAASLEGQHTCFDSIHKETLEHIDIALSELRLRCDRNARNSLTNFVLCKLHIRDQLSLLMLEEDEATQEDFNWSIQIKYHFRKHKRESITPEAEPTSPLS